MTTFMSISHIILYETVTIVISLASLFVFSIMEGVIDWKNFLNLQSV